MIVKGVYGHPIRENERDVFKQFQDRTPFIRPLIDEIEEPPSPSIIVLKHLDDHLLNASMKRS